MATGILREARLLLQSPPTHEVGLWERAAVLLARQAIEAALERFWEHHSADLKYPAPKRTQLVCLTGFMGGDSRTAGDVNQLWNTLSRACHYDDFALTPTASEILAWLDRADRLCEIMEQQISADP